MVEAEGFSQTGGWVVDPQFMDRMGSPYLLAHGLGGPVVSANPNPRDDGVDRSVLINDRNGKIWQDALPAVTGNERAPWAATFTAVKTRNMRLVITGTPLETSAIREVEFYHSINTTKEWPAGRSIVWLDQFILIGLPQL